MDSCNNKNVGCINYENICINCGTIHDYQYINEIYFRYYDINMSNILFYKNLFIKEKNIYIIYVCILNKLMTTYYYFLIIHWKTLENYMI